MFTTGKIVFALLFVVIFTTLMIVMYRKDMNLHKKYYKGSTLVFIAFLLFIGLLFLIKFYLKEK